MRRHLYFVCLPSLAWCIACTKVRTMACAPIFVHALYLSLECTSFLVMLVRPRGCWVYAWMPKAIKGWINRTAKGRSRLVSKYFEAAGGFSAAEVAEGEAS